MAEACSAWVSQSGMHDDTLVHCGWNGERGANGSWGSGNKKSISDLVCRTRDYWVSVCHHFTNALNENAVSMGSRHDNGPMGSQS